MDQILVTLLKQYIEKHYQEEEINKIKL
jgi:hypothetical protein